MLRVDLGEHKELLESFCAQRGEKVSQFVRRVLLNAMRSETAGTTGKQQKAIDRCPDTVPTGNVLLRRRELRISAQEDREINQRASLGGFSTFQGYVSALVRAHLGKLPQLTPNELRELHASNRCLVDLVQRQRNQNSPASVELVRSIECHLREVRQMIALSDDRWAA